MVQFKPYFEGYKYPHDYPEAWVDQTYVPEEVIGRRYYEPTGRGSEREIAERLGRMKAASTDKRDKKEPSKPNSTPDGG